MGRGPEMSRARGSLSLPTDIKSRWASFSVSLHGALCAGWEEGSHGAGRGVAGQKGP